MRDPLEGINPDGTITTGVSRARVPTAFEPLLAELVAHLTELAALSDGDVSLHLYGSVATGQAVIGRSDIDVVAFATDTGGMVAERARAIAAQLGSRHRHLTHGVSIGVWTPAAIGIVDGRPQALSALGDAAYGNRVFLRHYCARLAGTGPLPDQPGFPADRRAARGFNGDFPGRLPVWRQRLASTEGDAAVASLARGIARKALFAAAGLVSVHDHTWTTDRSTAATRWGQLHPSLRDDLDQLLAWGDGIAVADRQQLASMLEGGVRALAQQFGDLVGVWDAGS